MPSADNAAVGVFGGDDEGERFTHARGFGRFDKDLLALVKRVDLVAAEAGDGPLHTGGVLADDGEVGLRVERRGRRAVDLDRQRGDSGGGSGRRVVGPRLHKPEDPGDDRRQQRRRRADEGDDDVVVHLALVIVEQLAHGRCYLYGGTGLVVWEKRTGK